MVVWDRYLSNYEKYFCLTFCIVDITLIEFIFTCIIKNELKWQTENKKEFMKTDD